jgi:error-prone DNA polymerase
VSSWLKWKYPAAFAAALLNSQPMGFYAPAQIVRDAREHGVEALPVCINASDWDTIVVPTAPNARPRDGRFRGTDKDWRSLLPLRLGMQIVLGLSEDDAGAIVKARAAGPFTSVEDAWHRSGVKPTALGRLARADAFQCLGLNRRQALWAIKGLGQAPLPLLTAADTRAGAIVPEAREPAVTLSPLTAGREVVEDYRATQLTLRNHPLHFLRGELDRLRIRKCGDLKTMKDGARVEVAGIILVRQRPGSAEGVVFVTLEDETGIANAILWKDRFEAQRRILMAASMISVQGRVQSESGVIHVVADRIVDHTHLLRGIGDLELPNMKMPGDGATHGGTIDPRDRQKLPLFAGLEEVIPIKSHDFH